MSILMGTKSNKRVHRSQRVGRQGFTLTELLAVIAILVTLAATSLFALWGASESAKGSRTETIVSKIDYLIQQKWESYSTRRISLLAGAPADPRHRAFARVAAVRELQRLELPERKSDIVAGAFVVSPPAVYRGYVRRCIKQLGETMPGSGVPDYAQWTVQFQGSECLYLILSSLSDGDDFGLDLLRQEEIGDTDNDGMLEVLDAWRRPIDFIRWPAGFLANPAMAWRQNDPTLSIPPTSCANGPVVQVVTEQNAFYHAGLNPNESLIPAPDRFDPLRSDPRWRDASDPSAGTIAEPEHGRVNDPYELRPLVYSGGPDRIKKLDSILPDDTASPTIPDTIDHSTISAELQTLGNSIYTGMNQNYFRNDPYRFFHVTESCGTDLTFQIGTPRGPEALDNITNHSIEAQ